MCNKIQAEQVADTVRDVRTKGNYLGDIVVMHAKEDLSEAEASSIFSGLHAHFKSFPKNIDKYIVPEDLPGHGPNGRGHNQKSVWIYFFKFHILDSYFAKHWCRMLFFEVGIRENGDITNYLNSVVPAANLCSF